MISTGFIGIVTQIYCINTMKTTWGSGLITLTYRAKPTSWKIMISVVETLLFIWQGKYVVLKLSGIISSSHWRSTKT